MNSAYSEQMGDLPEPLADLVQNHMDDLGIDIGEVADATWLHPQRMTLTFDDRSIDVGVLYLPRMSATEALQAAHSVPQDTPLLVIGPRIHESSAKTFRARGIWYLDAAGNAFLRDRGLLVDVRGRRGDTKPLGDDVFDVGPTNPFSPRRAQVVFVLLSRPELTNAPFREIARHAGVSVGIAKGTVDTLAAIGFIEQTAAYRRLLRASELLDLWSSTYSANLGRANKLFVGSGEASNWSIPDGTEFAVSGEQAAPGYIRHAESLVIYVRTERKDETPADLLLRNRWHREPRGNITVRRMFWRDVDGMGEGIAPPLLVYADMLAAHEPRQAQAAQELRQDLEQQI